MRRLRAYFKAPLDSTDVLALLLGACAGAVWLLLFQADVAYADNCLAYVKEVKNFVSIPNDLLEDCMRTGVVQAAVTGAVGAIGGGMIAVAVTNALKGGGETAPQAHRPKATEPTAPPEETDVRVNDRRDNPFDPSDEEKRRKWEKDKVVWDPRELGWRLPRPNEVPTGDDTSRRTPDSTPPRGPTPEDIADIEAKRKKLEDIRKRLDDVPDGDRRKWAQGVIDRASKPNADGTPTGNLDDIDRTIRDFVEREKGNTTWGKIKDGVSEVVAFKEDFNKGVTKDLREIQKDVGDAVQKGIDKAADVAVDIVDANAGDRAARDRMDDRKKAILDAGDQVVNVVGKVVQSGIDTAADLAVDVVDNRARGIRKTGSDAWEATKGVVKDLADPAIRKDAMDGTFDDLLNPAKVEEAARKVPGLGKLIDATDGKRSATDRLVDGLLGAAELAGTADTLVTAGTLAKGLGGAAVRQGGKVLRGAAGIAENLIDDAARVVARNADDALRVVERNVDDAIRAGSGAVDDVAKVANKPAGSRARHLADEIDLGEARALSPEEMKKAAGEIDKEIEAVGKKAVTKVYPDALAPDAGNVAERTKKVQDALRKRGIREDLVKRIEYEPVADFERALEPGKHQTAGHVTPNLKELPTGKVHHPAFEQWDPHAQEWVKRSEIEQARVAEHELEHTLQVDRARTQAAKGGPLKNHYNAQGELTAEGFLYNEREAHIADLDRMLKVRSNALEQARRNPADAQKWLNVAEDANKQASHSKASLEVYGASAERALGQPVTLPDGRVVAGPRAYDPAKIPQRFPNALPGSTDVTLP